MDPFTLLFQWLIVFGINIIPAFSPPTWIVLSYFYISEPQNIVLLVLVGATASTCGRYVLALLSRRFFDMIANTRSRENMEVLRKHLQGNRKAKFLFSFIFSLGPLPSNALFIAAGAAHMKMREILLGFFIGRVLSYAFLVFTTNEVFSSFALTLEGQATLWTIAVEVIGVLAIIFFFVFDWKTLLGESKNLAKWPKKNKTEKGRN